MPCDKLSFVSVTPDKYNRPYARCTDARNPVESRRPGWVLNVQDPIVFIAISTTKWALKAFHTNTFSTVI